MLRQVRHNQPRLTVDIQMCSYAAKESVEHLTLRVVDSPFDRRRHFGRNPRGVADDQVSFAVRKKARPHQADIRLHPQAFNIVSSTQ